MERKRNTEEKDKGEKGWRWIVLSTTINISHFDTILSLLISLMSLELSFTCNTSKGQR